MKIAVLNDTHCGVRNSSSIFAKNEIRFYEKIFFPYLKKHGIKKIIHLGDVFDNRRHINLKSFNIYRKHFVDVLQKEDIHMDLIPGNHDVYYKNTNELNAPLELLGGYKNNITIHMNPVVIEYDSLRIGLVPWINSENRESTLEFLKTCSADWIGGHLELSGFEVMRGIKSHHGEDPGAFQRFEKVLSGHYHTKSQKMNVMYLGSQLEFTWADVSDRKFFHIIDTKERSVVPVENPHRIFHRINYDADKRDYSKEDVEECDNKFVKVVVINKGDVFTFDEFIDRIQARPIYDLKIAENFTEFVGENVEDSNLKLEDTEVLLDSYVDAVDTDLDKNRLKAEFRNLHTEALITEVY